MTSSSHRCSCSCSSPSKLSSPPNCKTRIRPPKSPFFSTILFFLLLAFCFLHAISSYLDPSYFIVAHDPGDNVRRGSRGRAFTGRRFLSAAGLLLRSATDGSERRYGGMIEGDENLLCDRSHFRTDVCVARGDVRVMGAKVVVLAEGGEDREERLRPYTRKWENSVMRTIDEVTMERRVVRRRRRCRDMPEEEKWISPSAGLLTENSNSSRGSDAIPASSCDVRHDVPAIVFSTGGYTGNVYHEFNDGIIPLFLTAAHLKGEVVLMVLEYHRWWMTKYAEIVSQISRYEVVDMANDGRVHCFREVKVGLHIHDELTIDASEQQQKMPAAMVVGADVNVAASREEDASPAAVTMADFREMLRAAYLPRLKWRREQSAAAAGSIASVGGGGGGGEEEAAVRNNDSDPPATAPPPPAAAAERRKPKLVMMLRESPRALVNHEAVRMAAEGIGFEVETLRPRPTTEMVDIYGALQGCDAMIGVHGAAMTHVLFMRPGATFIQVVPLGTQWAAETYYGRPAEAGMGVRYVAYEVTSGESSLSRAYPAHHPVLERPDLVNAQGWSETKRIYLDSQDVILSIPRLRPTLLAAFEAATAAAAPSQIS